MAISSPANVLVSLKRNHGIDEDTVEKIYALGWGGKFSNLTGFGAISQKVLDRYYDYSYPTTSSSLYDFVFTILGESCEVGSLIKVRENGLSLLDMLKIPQPNGPALKMEDFAGRFEYDLTVREYEIFVLKYCGQNDNQTIARLLSILPNTARTSLGRIQRKIKDTRAFDEVAHQVFEPKYFAYRKAKKNGEYLKPINKTRLEQLFPG